MLGVSVGYTAIDKYNQDIEQKQNELIQEAVQEAVMYGYEQAVVDLVNLVATCQVVPISIENTTIEIVAVECLNGV